MLRKAPTTLDLRAVYRPDQSVNDAPYGERWAHDKVVRSTHGVNCTGSCSWKVYVKDALITWETAALRAATSRSDRIVYPLLTAVPLAGLIATASGAAADSYDYRLGVSLWFRSPFALDPDVSAMAHAPLVHQVHALLAMALFALWPFSRLVHAFTAPIGYLARPYVVYRSRTPAAPYRHPATGARRANSGRRG
ncbi:respiratory nitrate reductase subunit gamma [Streptomyces sp. NPDC006692]|uniref:respiratory nitrate reductase subunit gamma n=1 Tax=Streptomyces sp. NPDC006692 TaxID=3364758 RepID=UPI003678B317